MPKVRREFVDADYLHKLSEKDLEWYAKFTNEYVGAALSNKNNIHKSKKHIKSIYDWNNRRNNDVYSVTKVNGLLTHYEANHSAEIGKINKPELVEEALIAIIDNKDSIPPEITERVRKFPKKLPKK